MYNVTRKRWFSFPFEQEGLLYREPAFTSLHSGATMPSDHSLPLQRPLSLSFLSFLRYMNSLALSPPVPSCRVCSLAKSAAAVTTKQIAESMPRGRPILFSPQLHRNNLKSHNILKPVRKTKPDLIYPLTVFVAKLERDLKATLHFFNMAQIEPAKLTLSPPNIEPSEQMQQ